MHTWRASVSSEASSRLSEAIWSTRAAIFGDVALPSDAASAAGAAVGSSPLGASVEHERLAPIRCGKACGLAHLSCSNGGVRT